MNNAIPFLQKCLAFASASPRLVWNYFIIKKPIFIQFLRYQFLVYNASVIYFNYVRPFFRDGYRKYLCDSFQQVVNTLIHIDDEPDYPWQAELLLYDVFVLFFFF